MYQYQRKIGGFSYEIDALRALYQFQPKSRGTHVGLRTMKNPADFERSPGFLLDKSRYQVVEVHCSSYGEMLISGCRN